MPPFLSQEEYESWALGAPLPAEKLDAFLTEFENQLEKAKARQAQTGSGVPLLPYQIYLELTDAVIRELNNKFENKAEAEAPVQTGYGLPAFPPHLLNLKSADRDGEIIERLSNEAAELRALLEQKNSEISEKDAEIDCYVNEMAKLMWSDTLKEDQVEEIELELAESRASCDRLSKELRSSEEAAVADQGRYLAEISTAKEQVGLYQKVIKDYYQKRLVEEKSARIEFEKEAASLKEKLEKYEAEEEKRKEKFRNYCM